MTATTPAPTPNRLGPAASTAPVVFDARVEAEAAKVAYPPYPFVGLDGEAYELPNPYLLTTAEMKEALGIESAGDLENVNPIEVVEKLAGTGTWAAIEAMPASVQARLIEAWNDHCQATIGDDESGKEPPQSSPTGPPASQPRPISPSGG